MSEANQTEITISDVLRLALPLDTVVTSGASHTRRQINWVVVLTDWSELSNQVSVGDVVLVPATLHDETTEGLLLEGLSLLAALAVSAVVVFCEVSGRVSTEAEELNLPLLVASPEASLRLIHRNIAALIVDRRAQTVERGTQLYRQLSEMSREGQGLSMMTEMMARLTGKLVVVQDKRLDIKAISQPVNNILDLALIREVLGQRENLPSQLRNRKAAARNRQTYWQQLLPVDNLARLVSPIVVGDRARGYLSVIGPPDSLDLLDSLTAEHGAAACALEMAKAKAVSEAKKALRGDFLEGLLAGRLPKKEIGRLATRLDHDTDVPHAILALTWDARAGEVPSLRRLETTINWLLSTSNRPALAHIYGEDHVCVFQALRDSSDMETAHELVRRLQDQIEAEYPRARFVGGVAGPALTLADWPQVHQQSLQAMKLGQRLGGNQLMEFSSLGVYQLLGQLEDVPAVQAFHQRMIGPLASYDAQHNSTLVRTLDAYFKHHGNVSQTAESLFIHRNTLLYRLERIQELTGLDLDQSDMRLAFHLALKLWQLRPEAQDEVS